MAKSCVEFGKFTVKLFHDVVLANKDYLGLILNQDAYYLDSYYMGMVDKDNKSNFYDGDIRVVDQTGKEFARFKPSQYLDVIAEHVEPWTYMKMPYLKKVGWKGFVTGPTSGIYRVGPLGRINVCDGYTTPLAQAEYEVFKKTVKDLGVTGPVHHTLAFHWARVIELQHAAERMLQLASDKSITSADIRGKFNPPKEGVGIVEAPRAR
ncbi:MAG: hypothetical protein MUE55_06115 [Thermoplasmata archaeon]|nr:hypothetical protein [Thermoplasmata archaeon]